MKNELQETPARVYLEELARRLARHDEWLLRALGDEIDYMLQDDAEERKVKP